MKNFVSSLIFFTFISSLSGKPAKILNFQHLGNEDGLSQSWVKCIFQDSYGYLWFGTGDGINQYNGYDFKVYKHNINNKNSLTNNTINVIYEDKNGKLWIGTQSGINLYNREQDNFFQFPLLQNTYISDFYELKNGFLIVLTHSGFFIIDPVKQVIIQSIDSSDPSHGLPHNKLDVILKDRNGDLWITTRGGLCLLDTLNYTFRTYRHDPSNPRSLAGNTIRSMIMDSQGRIWIGTNTMGLSLMDFNPNDPDKIEFINFRHRPRNTNSISSGAVLSLLEDRNGNLWIGTENGGLNMLPLSHLNLKNVQFTHYRYDITDPSSISSNSIHAIYEDHTGTIWIGTFGGGINFYSKLMHKFKHYRYIYNVKNTLNNNIINAIYDEGNRLWIGTEGGLNVLNKKSGTFRYYTHNPLDKHSIGSNAILCIFRDSRHNMWIGTWSGGLNLFHEKKGTFTRFLHDPNDKNSIGGNSIFSIIEDRDGLIWIATMDGGLNCYDYKTGYFKSYRSDENDPTSLSNDWTRDLYESHLGEIWVSTTTAVDIFNKHKGTFYHINHNPEDPNSITYNGAIVFFEDSRHQIWLGTEDGLNCFNRRDSTFTHFLQTDGLPNDAIKGICEDNHGNLWISTNNGISKFIRGVDLPEKPVFKNYSIDDGLQGVEFTRRACNRGKDGTLYFGGNNGFNSFHPDSIFDNPYVPEIVLTKLFIFNREAEIGEENSPIEKHISMLDEITLKYNNSVFSIEYAALNYLAPYQNQYAFKLTGFDNDWNYVGTQRLATYTNLNPGEYVFHVKGSNNDGIWNQKGTSIKVHIKPPFWLTAWFQISALVVIIALIFLGVQLRTAKIQSRNRELELHVKERTMQLEASNRELEAFSYSVSHDLRAPLRGMDGFSQSLLEEYSDKIDEKGRHYIQRIHTASQRMGQLIDDLLKLSRLTRRNIQRQRINLSSLVETMAEEFKQMDPERNVTFKIAKKIYAKGDISLIQIMLRNLIDNAWKFTSKKSSAIIEFDMIRQNKKNIYYIRDNGIGLDIQYSDKIFEAFHRQHLKFEGTGIGLATAQRIVIRHGGHIWADGKVNKGATFYFTLSDE